MSLPTFHQIIIRKKEIEDTDAFSDLVKMYNLTISYNEPDYYILDGDKKDLYEFVKYWKSS